MSTEESTTGTDATPVGTDYTSDRKFVDFPLSREVLQGILDHGYVTATPIQVATIEPALAGRNLLARAKTGTGKTAAFAIPIVEQVTPGPGKPQAIILAPTRELAQQIAAEIDALAAHKDISTATLVGGLAMGPQEQALERGAAIVVGTPGRVLDHYRRKNLDLSEVRFACLDEADEMVSMGFYEDVTKILSKTREGRQVLLFSATVSADTARLVRMFLNEPEHIILSTDEDRVEGIDHVVYEAPAGIPKARALMYVIDNEDPDAAIVFCNTREDTNTVARFLDRQGLDVILLSGELPQSRRSEVMRRVKAGEVRFLIATDVAARGIDISDLTHVFNYSLPRDAKVYLHRIGRTGRIGNKGTAISLLSGTDFSTRRTLELVHKIDFSDRPFPEEIEAIRKRVDRHAARIREAMGKLVFESYLPVVRAIKERDDADMLLAAALRGFFAWDRQRRAALVDVKESNLEPRNRDEDDDRRRDDDRGREKGDRKKGRKRDDDRKGGRKRDDDRRSRGRDGDRDGGRDGGKRRGREERDERPRSDDGDLDALLVASEPAKAKPKAKAKDKGKGKGKAKDKPKAKPRGKKKADDQKAEKVAPARNSGDDDLDALLSAD